MIANLLHALKTPRPVCIGTGLVALDVLVNGGKDQHPPLWAGGSCGNVLMILSYMGWQAYPISLVGKDEAGKTVLEDMAHWGVDTRLIQQREDILTPIIIERLSNKNGIYKHSFEFKCPNCGAKLPKNRPVSLEGVKEIARNLPKFDVYYFDRVSRASLELAKIANSRGSLVVFEPCKYSKENLFDECVRYSHVLKYSREQVQFDASKYDILLEIETVGAEGLNYRFKGNRNHLGSWKKIDAFHLSHVIDSSGAGDWCTAGLIHVLGQYGRIGFKSNVKRGLERALTFGQALAALNCQYKGARGLMYQLSKRRLKSVLEQLTDDITEDDITEELVTNSFPIAQTLFKYPCPECSKLTVHA